MAAARPPAVHTCAPGAAHGNGVITMIRMIESGSPKLLAFELSGKLHDQDYKAFVPVIDAAIREQGQIRLMAVLQDFHGWDLQALWDDIGFASRHFSDIERI